MVGGHLANWQESLRDLSLTICGMIDDSADQDFDDTRGEQESEEEFDARQPLYAKGQGVCER